MEHSETLGALAKALAKAQGEMGDARKDAQNPHFKNRYATLSSVRSAIQAPLAQNDLAVAQTTEPHGADGVCVVTTLLHASGEWLRGKTFVPVGKKDAQGFGSAITYARRYALAAICGVAVDDDDAELSVGYRSADSAPAPSPERANAPPSVDVAAMVSELGESSTTDALTGVVARQSPLVKQCSNAERAQLRAAYDRAVKRLAVQEWSAV